MKRHNARDISDIVPYSEQNDRERMPAANSFIIERHVPDLFDTPFHHHTSVEINFLEYCAMSYSFSGVPVEVRSGELTMFWGAQPHRVTQVTGRGRITNIYLSLGQFLRWGLPDKLVRAILSGAVLSARPGDLRDDELFNRLWEERGRTDAHWRRMHLDEIANRLRRLGLEGWQIRLDPAKASPILEVDARTMFHVEAILRYVADNFCRPVTVSEIAEGVNLSPSRATTLFREVMGVSIKHHLTRTRLSHARMLLTETDAKIVSIALDSGFGTLSTFYAAFTEANRMSPAQYRKEARAV
jgi:AraC-like DNA-binding protein